VGFWNFGFVRLQRDKTPRRARLRLQLRRGLRPPEAGKLCFEISGLTGIVTLGIVCLIVNQVAIIRLDYEEDFALTARYLFEVVWRRLRTSSLSHRTV